ncbi:uncharacterized protein [Physcomitrium patens]|uniref:Exostosin GT47 domain-containing protein n=1 Tax=Physcomitrium patens TaxID=3218 RepID=A0A2K1KVJ9_PHYPA|nr:exostosin-1c-like isoform X1 [Physcomitrium patens]XP_024371298.1 exostosin-1c-like isoform X1 [Physcomitrium patens]XP_024371299.1 exostosin-1c-like isoform X1 [Physcomitrium patens]PNR57817.1 hypothetical protein PHYPA_004811 [Physcomitrium patens]|eukprot:XP_024371297.1 exostosin-1c-like isoform X1 [Physcomitrella patens]
MGPKQCVARESLLEKSDEDNLGKVTPRPRLWNRKCTAVGSMCGMVRSTVLERRLLVMVILMCCVGFIFLSTSRDNLKPEPWHSDKMWHYPVAFPRCSIDACFNFSRCEHSDEILVYTYNDPEPKQNPTYFELLPSSKWHTNDPQEACLFFYFSDSKANKAAWKKPDPRNLPHWNGGLNHVFVTFADRWAQTNPPPGSIGMASILSTELHDTTYRPGFDIAIPLPRRNVNVITGLSELKPFERKYFLTFKGTRYLSREGKFRSGSEFRGMHDGKDVVVVTTCDHGTNNKLRLWQPWRGAGCAEDQTVFDSYDFMELLNTTFGLAPAGRSPASYRMLEVLSAGAIPVLVADNYVKPFETLIKWQRCLLQFPTSEIHRIVPTLRALSKKEVEMRQRYCQQIFQSVLKDDSTLMQSVMRSLRERFMGMLPNLPLTHDE